MKYRFVEATSTAGNFGKFVVVSFDSDDWAVQSVVDGFPLIRSRGWTPKHVLVFDLQTGEGAMFRPGGFAPADLNKHKIWVCPLFQPFLEWLYTQPDPTEPSRFVDLGDAAFALYGYRREGPPLPMRISPNAPPIRLSDPRSSHVVGRGCKAPPALGDITRAECYACGNHVCVSPSCSRRILWHGTRRRVCMSCADEARRLAS